MSAMSKPTFFIREVTIACFCDVCVRSWASEALIHLAMNSKKMSTDSRTRNVRTGSSEQDLTGDDINRRRASCSVCDLTQEIGDNATEDTGSGGRPAVC